MLPQASFTVETLLPVINDVHPEGFECSLDPLEILGNLVSSVWEGTLARCLGPRGNGTGHTAGVLGALAEAVAREQDPVNESWLREKAENTSFFFNLR